MRIRVLLFVALLIAGCGADPAAVPVGVPSVTVLPSGVTFAPPVPKSATRPCNPRESLRPMGSAVTAGSTMARIRERGRLVLGIGSSAYLLSHRDPYDGKVKGFEAEIAREVAAAIFNGDREKIQFRALNAAERIPAVRGVDDKGNAVESVDMVMAAMTMTCERWEQVAFSTEYYSAGQKVLVNKKSGINSTADLAGKKVCASATSTNIKTIAELPARPTPVAAANTSDCLVLLQQGQIDAVSTGDVILAGLAAQDEATQILPERFTDEPTGIAMSLNAPDLVRFVNGVLENLRTSGRWQQLHDEYLTEYIVDAKPPVPQYKAE
ncbi:ABC transporter substrate-binding protein [Kibdelosporangium aridum]|uniref:ABC transporter substrate-binding protein n=1 Tax=Kibdelosporangium aridum TaxID=2030 RepID=A0A428Z1G0_KIBAR|nr:glutamate ABC transporter substrate-binding protein [Kibdelosporangium aridum]RSM78674.1 ABC transporter substrate-binding protein [Kibdelosporangium aridum]